MLGENFDQEIPEAAHILHDTGYTSMQKATQLETWTRQVMDALDEYTELAQQTAAKGQAQENAETSVNDYLDMQTISQPYQQLATWTVERLRAGDITSVIRKFSTNFIKYLGIEKVETVFQQQMLPFFVSSHAVNGSSTVTMTTDGFGSKGFAFYMQLDSSDGKKPFIIYVVNENNQLVVANLVLNKTYEDMH